MHDRRIDGVPHIFGNYGALFMSAMTWWDHETGSVWSQPWGRSIEGDLKGVELFLLPSQVTTWSDWLSAHPETLVLSNNLDLIVNSPRQGFSPNFVLGLLVADSAKAFYYEDVAAAQVINDQLGEFPIVVWASEGGLHAYFRQVGDRTLTFRIEADALIDGETGSTWDGARGLATGGPLQGEVMQQVPGSTAFDWAWLDFFPASEFYTP